MRYLGPPIAFILILTSATLGLHAARILPNALAPMPFLSQGLRYDDAANPNPDSLLAKLNPNDLFLQAPQFGSGKNPSGMAVGDFNRDGRADVVVADEGARGISVLLGNGDGTFQKNGNYKTGIEPGSVAVGDFNGDGILDVAVTNYCGSDPTCQNNKGSVSILLGKGDGTFIPYAEYATGAGPESVVVSDFNGDGKADLAVAIFNCVHGCGPGSVSIFLGNGDGSFQTPQDFATGTGPTSVAVGDFNGDGKKDLALTNEMDNTVSILLGNGNGTFRTHMDYATALAPAGVAVGDFNGDGKADLAVANYGHLTVNPDTGNTVSILLGKGDGTFRTHVDYATGIFPDSVVVADFNGDGKADLAIANFNGNSVSVLLGNGDGSFQRHADYGTGSNTAFVSIGDFNGDGKFDLVASNFNENTISVLLGKGDGTFRARVDNSSGGFWPDSVAVGDFNDDGKSDLAVVNCGSCQSPSREDTVGVLLGNGDGTFRKVVNYPTGTSPQSVIVVDVNGDGKPDLVVADSCGTKGCEAGSVSVLLGNGDGTFQPPMDFDTGPGAVSVATGDFNRDGKVDLVTANIGGNSNTVSILLGNGDGTFEPHVDYTTGRGPRSVAVGDFNGDGKADLVTADSAHNAVSILLGNGDGTFGLPTQFAAGRSPNSVVIGDFNRDGNQDLAVTNISGTHGSVSILFGDGRGSFQPHVDYPAGIRCTDVKIGDFNGDGIEDLAVVGGASYGPSVLLGNSDGTFGAPTLFGAGYYETAIAVGDFNKDGIPDLVTANNYSNSVSVLLNETGTRVILTSAPNPSYLGDPVTFTAKVAASVKGVGTPKGTATF
jgi:uncharacterized protein YfaP (DUF2135 family)